PSGFRTLSSGARARKTELGRFMLREWTSWKATSTTVLPWHSHFCSLGAGGACVGAPPGPRQLIEDAHNSSNLLAVRRYSGQAGQLFSRGWNRLLRPDEDGVVRRQQDPALLFTTQSCPPLAGAWASVGKPILDRGCLLDLHFHPARPITNVELNNLELVCDY